MLLVVGASGFLGAHVTREASRSGRQVAGASKNRNLDQPGVQFDKIDLASLDNARSLMSSVRPDCVINCAALADVDACEGDPEAARRLNVDLPRNIARACAETGARLVHVSTDSVFDGRRGRYVETDEPAPVNVYGATKLDGERAVLDELPAALVVRTNFIGTAAGGGHGLADWIVSRLSNGERIKGFADVIFSPLLVTYLADVLLSMADAHLEGVYHASARDSCTKLDFAVMLARTLGLDPALIDEARLSDARLAAPRPLDSSLLPAKLEAALGSRMPSVADAVDGYACLRRPDDAGRFIEAGASSNADN